MRNIEFWASIVKNKRNGQFNFSIPKKILDSKTKIKLVNAKKIKLKIGGFI